MVRRRKVIVYDATVPEGDRAQTIIPYFDVPLSGEGQGIYWVPVAIAGGPRQKRRRLQKFADSVAKGIAKEYELRQGLGQPYPKALYSNQTPDVYGSAKR